MLKVKLRTSVTLPNGKVVSYRDAREAMVRRNAWLGLPQEGMKRKLLKQQEEFQKLAIVVGVFNRTRVITLAARAAGVNRQTAKLWLQGRRLPRAVSFASAAYWMRKRKPFRVFPEKSAEFAYVLGAIMGNATKPSSVIDEKEAMVSLTVKDQGFANTFSRKLFESTGLKAGVKTRRGYFCVEFNSRHFLQLYNELSLYNQELPEKFRDPRSPVKLMLRDSGSPTAFLGSFEERRQFAQAIYDSIGNINWDRKTGVRRIFLRSSNEKLSKFILRVLRENGLHPSKFKNGRIAIYQKEIPKFMLRIGFRKTTAG